MTPIELIQDVLRRGGDIARRHFGRGVSHIKEYDRSQVVTVADVEIARLAAGAIDAAFPDHNRIDEELGAVDRGSRHTWVIDPIDGTSNFAVGVPLYGIMIGLLLDGRPVASGISLPAFDRVYTAERGAGAFVDGQRLTIEEQPLASSLVACNLGGDPAEPERTREDWLAVARVAMVARGIRAANSIYDGALLAEGRYGGWLVWSSHIWDNVAAHLLVEEAGGVITRMDGSVLDYERPLARLAENFSVCAAARGTHAELLATVGHTSRW